MEAGNDAGEGPGESSTHFLCPSPTEGNDVPEPADETFFLIVFSSLSRSSP